MKNAGQKGMNSFRARYERFDAEFIKPLLVKKYQKSYFDTNHVVRVCMKIAMQDASEWAEAIKNAKKTKIYIPDEKEIKKEADTTQTTLYLMINQILDQKLNDLRDFVVKGQEIPPMITANDDIADDYLARRPRQSASVGSLTDVLVQNSNSHHETGPRHRSEMIVSPRRSVPTLNTRIHPIKKPHELL